MSEQRVENCWKRRAQHLFGYVLFLVCTTHAAFAEVEGSSSPNLDRLLNNSVGVVDQVVAVPFAPKRAFILEEADIATVRRIPALVVPARDNPDAALLNSEVLVGAKVPLEGVGANGRNFHFTFFLLDNVSSFAATPVKQWSKSLLKENSKPSDDLLRQVGECERKVSVHRFELEAVEAKLKVLRDRASLIAGIDQIVDLKMELQRLRGFGTEKVAERMRLKELIQLGRSLKDTPELDRERQQLSQDLREAAQATSMADRLNSRRRDAAMATVQKKVALIKEMKNINSEALAKEVLELRAKRRALEGQLNVGGLAGSEDF